MYNRLMKLREERANSEKGFTLIELLVVVVILGILIAIAIPLYLNYTKGANDKAAQSDLRGAVSVLEQCNSDNGSYPSLTPAATIANAVGAGKTCTGVANISKGSSLTYLSDGTKYEAWSTNSSGNKTFCYYSGDGGAVKQMASGWTAPTTVIGTC